MKILWYCSKTREYKWSHKFEFIRMLYSEKCLPYMVKLEEIDGLPDDKLNELVSEMNARTTNAEF